MVHVQQPPPKFQTDIALAAIHIRWLGKWEDILLYDKFPFVFCYDMGTFNHASFC
jgi:hypothetical protein